MNEVYLIISICITYAYKQILRSHELNIALLLISGTADDNGIDNIDGNFYNGE